MNNALFDDPRLAELYDVANPWRADLESCRRLASTATSVLDLGCGTGRLACALAADRHVTAVDPAGAMLDVARRHEGGDQVEWVRADARTVRLGRRFDLVLLTGHAFQVFLEDDDQRAVLETIAAHLGSDGRFVFDTRNPAIGVRENRTRRTYPERLTLPDGASVEAWNESTYDRERGVLSYVNGYRFAGSGEEISASARIRFTSRSDLGARIAAAGLAVDRWSGSWDGDAYVEDVSPEIIPYGRLALR